MADTEPASLQDQSLLRNIGTHVMAEDLEGLRALLDSLPANSPSLAQAVDFALLCQSSANGKSCEIITQYLLEEKKANPNTLHKKGRRGVLTCLLAAAGSSNANEDVVDLLLKYKVRFGQNNNLESAVDQPDLFFFCII